MKVELPNGFSDLDPPTRFIAEGSNPAPAACDQRRVRIECMNGTVVTILEEEIVAAATCLGMGLIGYDQRIQVTPL